jgi:hypothetical protein
MSHSENEFLKTKIGNPSSRESMSYSWVSREFLAGPPEYCNTRHVVGPLFPTKTLAELHAEANVQRESRRVPHVQIPATEYLVTMTKPEYFSEKPLFEKIYVRVVSHQEPPLHPKEIKLLHEDDNQAVAAVADGIKFGYLTLDDARFFRELEQYLNSQNSLEGSPGVPIKKIYIKRHENYYYDLSIEMESRTPNANEDSPEKYAWISEEFLAGPPGYCDSECVWGPLLPSKILAELHAKANVKRETDSYPHVRSGTNQYKIVTSKSNTKGPFMRRIYVRANRIKDHEELPMFPKEFEFLHEDDNVAVIGHGIKFGYLTPEDADFFRELEKYPIKEVYMKDYGHNYYDIGIEMD